MYKNRFSLVAMIALSGSCLPAQDADDFQAGGSASTNDGDPAASRRVYATQGSTGEPTLLPPSSAFRAFLQQASQGTIRPAAVTAGSQALGYVAPPLHVTVQTAGLRAQAVQSFPSSYDLRTTGKLSPIRDQGNCGSCWAFAAFGAAESQLLPAEGTDFSEEHLNDWSGFDIAPCNGGNAAMSIAYMSRWAGPVAETADPYTAGASSKINQDKPAIKHLESALTIPDRTGSLDNAGIKSAVMTYGAVMTTMLFDGSGWNNSTNSYYYATAGHYSNHAVAIVGWDDSYAASNFSKAPPGKGAFLVRNSWGTWWGEAGYFHISYYDSYVGQENNVFDVLNPATDFTAVYQYDKYGATAQLGGNGSVYYQANTYTAISDAPISAVSLYTLVPDTTVDVSIWSSPVGANPSSGTRVGVLSGVAEPFAGYHTISLTSLGAQTHRGQTFSVVLRLTASQVSIPVEYKYSGYSSHVTARAGVTFFGTDVASGVQWTDVGSIYQANIPIKVFVGGAGSCDDGNPCTTDTGTPGNCHHTPVAAGTTCRPAVGVCDKAEVCDGKGSPCPADTFAVKGIKCGAAADVCDTAALCTGTSAACPANGFKPSTTMCRAAAGPCDVAENCTGSSASCPADKVQPKSVVCHAAVSDCDSSVVCDGVGKTCSTAKVKSKGTVCRTAAGVCDVTEVCDGQKATCPANVFVAKGTQCRAATGVCDIAATCAGNAAACPANAFRPKTTVCRPAAGPCDVAETCTGASANCAADAVRSKGYVCSASPKATCSGIGVTCAGR